MKRVLLACVLFAAFASVLIAQSTVAGKWLISTPGRGGVFLTITLDFKVDGAKLTGTVAVEGRPEIAQINGKIENGTLNFTLKSPDGLRDVTLTGAAKGDEIEFKREVKGNGGGANGIYAGAEGPKTLKATRAK
jgi:hypothetical protein